MAELTVPGSDIWQNFKVQAGIFWVTKEWEAPSGKKEQQVKRFRSLKQQEAFIEHQMGQCESRQDTNGREVENEAGKGSIIHKFLKCGCLLTWLSQ